MGFLDLSILSQINAITAAASSGLEFLPDSFTEYAQKMFKQSVPTDYIEIDDDSIDNYHQILKSVCKEIPVPSKEEYEREINKDKMIPQELVDKYYEEGIVKLCENGLCLPEDIFFADNIPLHDVIISYKPPSAGVHYLIRVLCLPDEERHKNLSELYISTDKADVALIEITYIIPGDTHGHSRIYSRVEVDPFDQYLHMSKKYSITPAPIFERIKTADLETRLMLIEEWTQKTAVGFIAWYVLQITLLNPVLKPYISRIRVPNPFAKNKNKKINRTTICYAKMVRDNIRINPKKDDEEEVHHKTKDLWYVTGHWREYKSGKRVFIKGYWKGVNRDNPETVYMRERVINEECDLEQEEL